MLKVTQLQRDNLLYALNVMWPAIELERIVPALAIYHRRYECGTLYCFGGHVALDPHFAKQGVRPHLDQHGESCGFPELGELQAEQVAEHLFGLSTLFQPRGGLWVSGTGLEMPYESIFDDRTDHQIVTDRLQFVLDNSEVVA